MKYKAYVPKWSIIVEADSYEEAYSKAIDIYDDHKDQDPMMG